jgi:hypothetical protein
MTMGETILDDNQRARPCTDLTDGERPAGGSANPRPGVTT